MRRLTSGRTPAQLRQLRFSWGSSMGAAGQNGGFAAQANQRLVIKQTDLMEAAGRTRPSVSKGALVRYEEWAQEFAAN